MSLMLPTMIEAGVFCVNSCSFGLFFLCAKKVFNTEGPFRFVLNKRPFDVSLESKRDRKSIFPDPDDEV